MGPWAHQQPFSQPTSGGTGDIDFGPDAAVSLVEIERQWFDHYVRDDGNGLPRAPVSIFVMGENGWREEGDWPLARAVQTEYYVHSGGSANTLDGDGTLSTVPPGDEPSDRYRYDPDAPVPTAGGRTVGGGVADQRPNQGRRDVLVYTGPSLTEDLEITGPVTVNLYAATSAIDTDFIAVLSDVRPDGYAQNLAEGIVRGRFRDSYAVPTPLEPGRVHAFEIRLWNVSHVLRTGHRLRLHITSSDFPRWERNPGTWGPSVSATKTLAADQRVFHDREHPSHVTLPVVPR
jgi:putative CocE/NonD family hydrolase